MESASENLAESNNCYWKSIAADNAPSIDPFPLARFMFQKMLGALTRIGPDFSQELLVSLFFPPERNRDTLFLNAISGTVKSELGHDLNANVHGRVGKCSKQLFVGPLVRSLLVKLMWSTPFRDLTMDTIMQSG